MTRRSIVKRSDRAKRMRSTWDSKEIYRDGLTYREWMSRRAKAQRDRELAAARTQRAAIGEAAPAAGGAGGTDRVDDAAPEPVRDQREGEATMSNVAVTEEPARGADLSDGSGTTSVKRPGPDDPDARTSDPAPVEAHPKGRRSRWRRTRR